MPSRCAEGGGWLSRVYLSSVRHKANGGPSKAHKSQLIRVTFSIAFVYICSRFQVPLERIQTPLRWGSQSERHGAAREGQAFNRLTLNICGSSRRFLLIKGLTTGGGGSRMNSASANRRVCVLYFWGGGGVPITNGPFVICF